MSEHIAQQWSSLVALKKPWVAFVVAGAAIMLVIVFYIEKDKTRAPATLPEQTQAIYVCMDKIAQQTKHENVDIAELWSIYSLCYNTVATQFLTEEQMIRNDNLLFQRSENVVLMWMVVLITLSGVALAGLQLLASYRLASLGKAKTLEGSEVKIGPNSVVVKSSIIGVVILAISFAFFMIFVLYVYTLKDETRVVANSPPLNPMMNVGRIQPTVVQPAKPPQPQSSVQK